MTDESRSEGMLLRTPAGVAAKAFVALGVTLVIAGCGDGDDDAPITQAAISARAKNTLAIDSLKFKDLNNNGQLDPYEDWRRSPADRAADLLSKMTLQEKAGLVNTYNMGAIGGNYPASELGGNPTCAAGETGKKYLCEISQGTASLGATAMLNQLNARFFIIRSNPPAKTLATFLNSYQEVAEGSRLGIPVVIISNPRNHAAAGLGLSEAAGVFSYWPGTLGIAATQDPQVAKDFADTAAKEWRATGLRKGYMYQVEIASEPRWTRNNGTFGEDPDLVAAISRQLVLGFQGPRLGTDSIALTMKHFPGNGIAPRGVDSHDEPGKFAVYPTEGSLTKYQLKGFQAAMDAGVASIMTNYQAPKNAGSASQLPQAYWFSPTQQFEEVGQAYNAKFMQYAREVMGFKGYFNTDSQVAVTGQQVWGVENLTVQQRIAKSLNSGISLLSIASSNVAATNAILAPTEIINAINAGLTSEAQLNRAATDLLKEMFTLGIFENPYVDPDNAAKVVHSAEAQAKADLAQRKSIVLLKNDADILPLAKTSPSSVRIYGEVFAKTNAAASTASLRALLKAQFPTATLVDDYNQATHAFVVLQPSTFTGTDTQGSYVKIDLDADTGVDVAKVKAIEAKAKTIISINLGQPWLLNQIEPGAAAILGTYDVTSDALFDVVTGAFKPTGGLPMGIPKNQAAVDAQAPDVPGNYESIDYAYKDAKANIYKFGFGLRYK